MNSGGATAGGLFGALPASEAEHDARERAGEAAAQLWLSLSQRMLAQPVPSAGQAEPPKAWRPSAGVLTPGAAAGGSVGDAPAEPSTAERLTLRVDGGELGELSVTLDRRDGALSVVIGLEKPDMAYAVAPDARALRLALENAGLNVHSLRVVPTDQVGIVLAQRRSIPSEPKPAVEPERSSQHPEPKQKRNHKRLAFIG